MTNEAETLCMDIMQLYLKKVQLPEELGIQIFEWGLDNYVIGERYLVVRMLCDELMTSKCPPERVIGRRASCA